MDFPYLSFQISASDLESFLEHWASRYRDTERDKSLYDPYIGQANLRTDVEALRALFTWKNGGSRIAARKWASIQTNYFSTWVEDEALESRYLNSDKGGGPIWNIFYLHCRLPDKYPIYDQHTHRAIIYIGQHEISRPLTKESPAYI